MPHVSKSQLEQLMSCPRLYYYERFVGLGGKASLPALLGSAYHKTWDEFFRLKMTHQKVQTVEWVQDTARDHLKERLAAEVEADNIDLEKGEDDKAIDTAVGLVTAYHPYGVELEPIAVEKQYELSIPGHDWTLYGYIDLVYKSYLVDEKGKPLRNEDGTQKWVPVVVDHKTASSSPYDDKKPGRQEQWLQVNAWSQEAIGYALAYRVVFGKTEDRFEYHYAVKTKEPRIVISPIRIGDQQIRWYMDLAVEQIERIKRGYFERNVTSWKHTPRNCPAWNQCHGILEPSSQGSQLTVV